MFKVYAKRGYKIISWEEVEIRSYIENTIFWCYAAFVGSDTSIFPTTESYSEYLSDLNAEITFPSIGDYVCSVARPWSSRERDLRTAIRTVKLAN